MVSLWCCVHVSACFCSGITTFQQCISAASHPGSHTALSWQLHSNICFRKVFLNIHAKIFAFCLSFCPFFSIAVDYTEEETSHYSFNIFLWLSIWWGVTKEKATVMNRGLRAAGVVISQVCGMWQRLRDEVLKRWCYWMGAATIWSSRLKWLPPQDKKNTSAWGVMCC